MVVKLKKININALILVTIICSCILTGCKEDSQLPGLSNENASIVEEKYNQFDNLCVPTQIVKIEDNYFIVDCYHNQIIYSKSLDVPFTDWKILTNDIVMGHSIATDGVVYLCDDTENNRVLVFAHNEDEEDFYRLNDFDNIGRRPHYIQYDEKRNLFYAISSLTGEIYIFKRKTGTYNVKLDKIVQIPSLNEVYIRSFSIIDDLIYMPAGDGNIYVLNPDNYKLQASYKLPNELGGPVQLSKIRDYYYLTVSTDSNANPEYATIVVAGSLEDFANKKYEDIKNKFCEDGTPYVITDFDDSHYIAWHSENGANCLWKFTTDSSGLMQDACRVIKE